MRPPRKKSPDFRMLGEAYASDASSDLELDYELICKIMDDLD